MSRRYGRKQRRAAREMLLDQACVIRNMQSRLTDERVANRGLRNKVGFLQQLIKHWDSEIRGLLGPYTSFAIEDATYRVDSPDEIRRMPVMPRLSSMDFIVSVNTPLQMEQMTYYVETMLSFIAGLEEQDQVQLRRLLTMRICIGRDQQQSAYYAFSESMWRDLKKAGPEAWERIMARVAHDLVRLIASPPKPKNDTADALAYAFQSGKG